MLSTIKVLPTSALTWRSWEARAGLSAPSWSPGGAIPPAARYVSFSGMLLNVFLVPSVFIKQKPALRFYQSGQISCMSCAGSVEQPNPQQTSIPIRIPVPAWLNTGALCLAAQPAPSLPLHPPSLPCCPTGSSLCCSCLLTVGEVRGEVMLLWGAVR